MFRRKNDAGIFLGIGLVICACFLGFAVKTGVSLKVEGVWNRKSVKDTNTEASPRQVLRHIYTAEIGVQEATGKNDGPRIQEYLHAVGLKGNYSYCASFITWTFHQAGMNGPRTGWSPALFPQEKVIWERSHLLSVPQTSDVFGIYFSELKRIGHCGFVEAWDGMWCMTVEANTANPIRAGPSTEGVYRKKRLVKTIYKVADWVTLK